MEENQLQRFLLWVGRLAGIVGVLIFAVAVVVRLGGTHHLMGFQAGTVLQGGVAMMVLGCLGYLALIARRK
jgi:hypothetical protein